MKENSIESSTLLLRHCDTLGYLLSIPVNRKEVSRRFKDLFITRLHLGTENSIHVEKIYEDQDYDHVATAIEAYKNPTIYHWLLSKKAP